MISQSGTAAISNFSFQFVYKINSRNTERQYVLTFPGVSHDPQFSTTGSCGVHPKWLTSIRR